jgi:2-dehydro-3-deoxygalactonokinase
MPAAFVNCDWGTSRLRLRAVRIDPWQVTTEFRSLDGVAALAELHPPAVRPQGYRSLLLDGLQPLLAKQPDLLTEAPILISGMASSSIGWQELPYARLPQAVDGSGLTCHELPPVESRLGAHRVLLISGVCSDSDVMRGEETELVGLFSLPLGGRLAENSLVIKPGTHSKHLRVTAGRLVSFQTFMTGELFDVLSRHSILQHSLENEPQGTPVADETPDLRAGVRHALSLPLAASLFRVRTRQLLNGVTGASNRAFLSGMLIGAELAYLQESGLAELPLVLCATQPLANHYLAALEELGVMERVTVLSADETEMLSARGQAVVWRRIAAARH